MQSTAKHRYGLLLHFALALAIVLAATSAVQAGVVDDAEAFWAFGTDLSDSTGNHDGTGVNSPQVVVAPDGFGKALHLEGPSAEQYIDFGTANPMALGGALTVSAWIRPDTFSTAGSGGAVILGDEDNRDWLRVTTSDTVTFKVDAATTTITTVTPDPFTTNEWQHVVLTRDAANNVTIYRNTDQVATGTRTRTFYPEYIGLKAPNATTNYYKGYMADVGVWDSVLTSGQIDELYMRGVDPVRGALAFWTFDSDFSNSGTAGSTLDGAPETLSPPLTVTHVKDESIVGSGGLKLRGSGSNKDYLQIGEDGLGDPVGLSLDGEMTIAVWLNPEALASSATFLGGTNADWIRIHDTYVYTRFGNTSVTFNTDTDFNATQWQHFMLTRDADDKVTIYRNLEEVASGTLAGTFEPLYIGLKSLGGSSVNYYRGLMDDFGIWDKVLSPLEMQMLYSRVPEPGSAILLLCGVIAALSWRRRR